YQDWKLSYKKEASSNKKIGKIEEKVQFIDVLKEMNKLDGWNSNYKNGYKFIDLFSGAGGLSCGLVMAGFEPIASVEIMPDAVETYVYNFQNRKKKRRTYRN
ncbi:DNA cytosine methyltransferase, partial [Mesomycoplasma hyorhinis]|uniref:DNA cytosine methyltransferase n=1 Tax=Mesomycoplasma hyorhinis TaxID=2100 RepID=UPI00280B0A27